ncbi:MAG TPA: hypothetical protein VIL74_17585 [Pyrinomonadaceae bacterium]|jgi:Flp pilus assembly protein TadB
MSANLEKYRGALDDLYRRAKEEAWTPQTATLLLLCAGVLVATIFFNVAVFSFGHWIVALVVYFLEALAPLAVLHRHRRGIDEAVRAKTSEMESTHPGISEAYREWRGGNGARVS